MQKLTEMISSLYYDKSNKMYMLNFQAPADVQMRLYSNNITPHESSALADFTESAAATPYTAVTLTGGSWTVASGATAGSTGTYAQQNFNFSTADTIYGYFITSGGARTLLWAERKNVMRQQLEMAV